MLLVVLYEMLCAARDVQAILRALVRAIWQMMLRATIACIGVFDVANDAARKNCVRVCNWICARCFPFIVACDIANDAGCNQLYSVQKAYIAAVSHDADCVSCWTLCCVGWQQASWCVLCSTRFDKISSFLSRSSYTRCDCCDGPMFGPGVRVIKAPPEMFGIKNLPFLFNACTQTCRRQFSKSPQSLQEWMKRNVPLNTSF